MILHWSWNDTIKKYNKINKEVLGKNKDLESSLKEAKNRLKDLEKQTTSEKEGFWRKEVVIPLVLLVLVAFSLGFVVYFKRRRKK